MSDLRLLQEGRLRRSATQRRIRRRRRIRRAFGALLIVVVAVAAVATRGFGAFDGSGAHADRSVVANQASIASTKHVAGATPPSTPALQYGATPASTALRARVLRDLKGTVIDTQPLKSGLLFDVRTGKVLWSRRPTEELPIASLTKMMTALLVVAHSPASAKVLVTKQAVDFTGSGVGLLPLHKRVSELALLYGLLLPSGNDAAIALAQHVAGHQSAFIDLMNARAAAMGLTCTHYTTVDGVIDQGNHSCAQNLAVLAHAVLSNHLLAKIVGSSEAVVKFPIKGGKLYLTNNNPLYLAGYAGTDGVKTGYTTKAGMCLVATVRRGRRWLGIVLLHSANWLTQAEALLNAGFAATA